MDSRVEIGVRKMISIPEMLAQIYGLRAFFFNVIMFIMPTMQEKMKIRELS